MHRWSCVLALLMTVLAVPAWADEVIVTYLGSQDSPVEGARLAMADNVSTGRFLGLHFRLEEERVQDPAEIPQVIAKLASAGRRFVVSGLDGAGLDAALASPQADKLLFVNAGASDDRFRLGPCRDNLLHTAPSRAMLADGLAQFLVKKRWNKWFLIQGRGEGDHLFAAAMRRAAKRFGAKVVAEKEWPENADLVRSAQAEIPVFTQGPAYDVVIVTDEAGGFGPYIPYQTWDPRPVAGTHGLVTAGWHPAVEQWGALQLQSRFSKLAGRPMQAPDYAAWLAVRVVGEAAARVKSDNGATIEASLRAPDFEIAAFKGRRLAFRPWNGQLRQPIVLAADHALVSQSPQDGFLHPDNDMDTLGYDRPESACKRGKL